MTQKTKTFPTNKPVVVVFGATGHTGRFVIAELLRREMTPIAIARDAKGQVIHCVFGGGNAILAVCPTESFLP